MYTFILHLNWFKRMSECATCISHRFKSEKLFRKSITYVSSFHFYFVLILISIYSGYFVENICDWMENHHQFNFYHRLLNKRYFFSFLCFLIFSRLQHIPLIPLVGLHVFHIDHWVRCSYSKYFFLCSFIYYFLRVSVEKFSCYAFWAKLDQ